MKYIVYKTTNIINNKIYVGVHKTIDPNIFDGYIGCGVKINNPSSYKYSKTAFQAAVNKYGPKNFKREVITYFDTEEEAYKLEAEIVNESFLSRPDVYNMILGGLCGFTNDIKCFQYDDSGHFIKEYDSIADAAFSIKQTSASISKSIRFKNKCGGYYWNTDKVDNIDLSLYNPVVKPIKVYRYLVDGGKFDKEFNSISLAAKESNATIVQVSRSAKICYRVGIYQFLFIKAESYDKAKQIYINNRSVTKYDSNGNFIKNYNSQMEAELENPNSNITSAIKNKKLCKNGFYWSLEQLPVFMKKSNSKKIKVGKFDSDGNLLETWESVKACINDVGMSRNYITIGKLYKGFLYKHIEKDTNL